jgi:hypothetical protein
VQLAALLASYVAMLAERRSAAVSDDPDFRATALRATAHGMAQAAAHNSLLSLISGRTGPKGKGGR